MEKVIQMGFDIEVSKENESNLEELFERIEDTINNFKGFKSIGIFNEEDLTEQYKAMLWTEK